MDLPPILFLPESPKTGLLPEDFFPVIMKGY
jgi:hypothetical protein